MNERRYNVKEEENMADQRLQWCTKHDDDELASFCIDCIFVQYLLQFTIIIFASHSHAI